MSQAGNYLTDLPLICDDALARVLALTDITAIVLSEELTRLWHVRYESASRTAAAFKEIHTDKWRDYRVRLPGHTFSSACLTPRYRWQTVANLHLNEPKRTPSAAAASTGSDYPHTVELASRNVACRCSRRGDASILVLPIQHLKEFIADNPGSKILLFDQWKTYTHDSWTRNLPTTVFAFTRPCLAAFGGVGGGESGRSDETMKICSQLTSQGGAARTSAEGDEMDETDVANVSRPATKNRGSVTLSDEEDVFEDRDSDGVGSDSEVAVLPYKISKINISKMFDMLGRRNCATAWDKYVYNEALLSSDHLMRFTLALDDPNDTIFWRNLLAFLLNPRTSGKCTRNALSASSLWPSASFSPVDRHNEDEQLGYTYCTDYVQHDSATTDRKRRHETDAALLPDTVLISLRVSALGDDDLLNLRLKRFAAFFAETRDALLTRSTASDDAAKRQTLRFYWTTADPRATFAIHQQAARLLDEAAIAASWNRLRNADCFIVADTNDASDKTAVVNTTKSRQKCDLVEFVAIGCCATGNGKSAKEHNNSNSGGGSGGGSGIRQRSIRTTEKDNGLSQLNTAYVTAPPRQVLSCDSNNCLGIAPSYASLTAAARWTAVQIKLRARRAPKTVVLDEKLQLDENDRVQPAERPNAGVTSTRQHHPRPVIDATLDAKSDSVIGLFYGSLLLRQNSGDGPNDVFPADQDYLTSDGRGIVRRHFSGLPLFKYARARHN